MSSTDAEAPRFPLASGKRLAHALVVVALQTLSLLLGFAVLYGLIVGPSPPFTGSTRELAFVAAMAALGALGVVGGGIVAWGRTSLAELGWRAAAPAQDLSLGAAAFIACALPIAALSDGGLGGLAAAVAGYTPAQHLLFVCIGAQAAFIEESVFRGYLQPALVTRLGTAGGVVVAAVIFSAYHLGFQPGMHPIGLAVKLYFGLIFGALFAWRRSLVAPATAHFLLWAVLGPA